MSSIQEESVTMSRSIDDYQVHYKPSVLLGPDSGALSAKYSEIPPRALNGGLYTGKPFIKGAPWANKPVRPETVNMIYNSLQSMHVPPEEAIYLFPGGGIRPGNNVPELPVEYINTLRNSDTNSMCIPTGVSKTKMHTMKTPPFSSHEYIQY
jgi:hypothetical protein